MFHHFHKVHLSLIMIRVKRGETNMAVCENLRYGCGDGYDPTSPLKSLGYRCLNHFKSMAT